LLLSITDRQTDRYDPKHYHAAFTGGINKYSKYIRLGVFLEM